MEAALEWRSTALPTSTATLPLLPTSTATPLLLLLSAVEAALEWRGAALPSHARRAVEQGKVTGARGAEREGLA